MLVSGRANPTKTVCFVSFKEIFSSTLLNCFFYPQGLGRWGLCHFDSPRFRCSLEFFVARHIFWSNYSDLTRPGPPKGSVLERNPPKISGKPGLVKYYNLARYFLFFRWPHNQLMVNGWFGARCFGFLESPSWKGLLLGCTTRIPNHQPISTMNH